MPALDLLEPPDRAGLSKLNHDVYYTPQEMLRLLGCNKEYDPAIGGWLSHGDGDDTVLPVCTSTTSTHTSTWAQLFSPYPVDALPILVHSLMDVADIRADSIWRDPSFTMAVAAVYWARDVFMLLQLPKVLNTTVLSPDIFYAPMQETVRSTKPALQSAPLLYLVLAVQPLITIVAFALNIFLYTTPVGKDFGLVSILSGVDWQTHGLLQGAEFSGHLEAPLTLDIWVKISNRLGYFLSSSAKVGKRAHLEKKAQYS